MRVRDHAAGSTGTIGWITAVPSTQPGQHTTFWYDVHLDDGPDGVQPSTFTADALAPLTETGRGA